MNYDKVRSGLQDLIIRLQDAEKGYNEIYNASSNQTVKQWMKKYAKERHDFHKELEMESSNLGGDPTVKTSILGELHRAFIDIKLNAIDDTLPTIIDEIERGSNVLIRDYYKVLELEMPEKLNNLLRAQKDKIIEETNSMIALRDELLAPA